MRFQVRRSISGSECVYSLLCMACKMSNKMCISICSSVKLEQQYPHSHQSLHIKSWMWKHFDEWKILFKYIMVFICGIRLSYINFTRGVWRQFGDNLETTWRWLAVMHSGLFGGKNDHYYYLSCNHIPCNVISSSNQEVKSLSPLLQSRLA